jgi:hypothetical protein
MSRGNFKNNKNMTELKDLVEFKQEKESIENFLKEIDPSAELLSYVEIEKKYQLTEKAVLKVIDQYKDNPIAQLLIAYYLACKNLEAKTNDIPNKQ